MAHEIEVTVRIRVTDIRLRAAGMTPEQFASNMMLFEHGFDVTFCGLIAT